MFSCHVLVFFLRDCVRCEKKLVRKHVLYVGEESYTVECQLDVSCVQCGGSLVWADDWSKVIKGSVDFHQEAFVLAAQRKNRINNLYDINDTRIWADVKWSGCSHDTMPDINKILTRGTWWSYFKNIFDDPLLIVVAGLQVFHVEFEQI